VIAIGYMNRTDQAGDYEDSRTRTQRFVEAVNTAWSTDVPTVQLFITWPTTSCGSAMR
jgi:hypothetical protein